MKMCWNWMLCSELVPSDWVNQVSIICIALLTLQIVSKQLYISFKIFRRGNSVILLWSDKVSSLNVDCGRVGLCRGLIWFSVVLARWPSRRQGLQGSVSGAHLVVLISANVQGCRSHLLVLIHHLIWIRTGSGWLRWSRNKKETG